MGDAVNIPVEFRAQVKQVFEEWLRLCDEAPEDSNHDAFVSKLQQLGYLKVRQVSCALI